VQSESVAQPAAPQSLLPLQVPISVSIVDEEKCAQNMAHIARISQTAERSMGSAVPMKYLAVRVGLPDLLSGARDITKL